MSDMVFASKRADAYPHGSWKILIVDDDPGIHAITKTVLRDLIYENRTLDFLSAFGRGEAERLLRQNPDICLILLDVVMEEDDSGLRLVRFVRETVANSLIRIILRTGQPGKAPSQQVIVEYDINDYEEKTDLTAQKLYTTVIASLRNYRDLESLDGKRGILERHRSGLSRVSEATSSLYGAGRPVEFAKNAYRRMISILEGMGRPTSGSFVAIQDVSHFGLLAGDGEFAKQDGTEVRSVVGDEVMENLRALRRDGRTLLFEDGGVYFYKDARSYRLLLHARGVGRMEAHDRQILDIFATNLSLAFENMRLNREIVGTQEDLIARLGEVVETRSHDTAQHVRRVGELSGILAAKLGYSDTEVHELKLASALHDIGKVGIPDDILLKPDVLNEQEFAVVKTHTEIGYNLLAGSSRPLLRMAAQICLQHHERFDGTGYPRGLRGEEIQVNARIVALCDVFDSLTHGRLHREPWDIDRVADHLKEGRGQAFDPMLVDLFLDGLDAALDVDRQFPD